MRGSLQDHRRDASQGPLLAGPQREGLTVRQRKVVNLLLDAGPNGFEGVISTKKYDSITGASRATASRELIERKALGLRLQSAGRSTRYYVNLPGWGPRPV